jgi:hypothetical protein
VVGETAYPASPSSTMRRRRYPAPHTDFGMGEDMPRKPRVLAKLSACLVLCSISAGRAETVVRAVEAPVVLHLMAVDDGIACALNGRDVAAQSRGQGAVLRDITPDLRRGRNTLRCRIADKDGGHCFAWRYRIAAGEAVSHERQHSCCDPGCARSGGAIDDDPVVINFQPPG